MTSSEFKDKIISLSPRIYPMVARMLQSEEDARDAIQEIMYRLWKSRKKLASHPNCSAYVFLTARNYCLDQLKSRKMFEEIDSIIEYNITKSRDQFEDKESSVLIKKIIEELPDKQKTTVVLRDIDGLEFNEIEALTGEKIENIRVHLSRARKSIGKKLTEIYEYEYGERR